MSKAENSFIHQHYMVLFSTVLHHYVCKISLMSNIENSDVVPDDNYVNNSLRDILFHSGRLQVNDALLIIIIRFIFVS
jgi:hypothetical protein